MILTVWAAGADPPASCAKLSDALSAAMVPAFTLNTTGIVTGLSATAAPPGPVAVMVMVPE